MPAFIYLSVDILLRINLLEKHRRNGKKQPKLISRDRPKTANSGLLHQSADKPIVKVAWGSNFSCIATL
ncbi:hypothetical protein [Pseudomonas sp. P5_C3]